MSSGDRSDGSGERSRAEQFEVLGFNMPRADETIRAVLITAWRTLWSMGKGAGAASFMRSVAALAARGHSVHVIQPRGRKQDDQDFYAGAQFHRYLWPEVFSDPSKPLPARLFSRAWRYFAYIWLAYPRVLQIARRLAPDVVIALGTMSAPIARRVADRLGVPMVGRYFGGTLCMGLNNRLRWYGNFMDRIGFKVPVEAMIMTNDGASHMEVFKRLGVDLRPVHFLRNGVDYELMSPGPRPADLIRSLGLPDDAFVMLTVTRLHPEKKLDRAIRALAGLRPRVKDAYLVLLGDGPERHRLQELAEDLGVAEAVLFPGPVRNVELPPWYRMADVVLSLLDRTNAANPVFEAMACGRCVVALDVGTTREVVVDGQTGVLVKADELGRLPEILEHLARHPEEREALGRAARPHVIGLCGSVEERMLREARIVEEVARTRSVVVGNVYKAGDGA